MTPNCMHCNQPFEAHAPQSSGDSLCPDGKHTFNCEFQINPEAAAFVKANLDKPSDELAQLWIERVRQKNREKRNAALIRIFTPDRDHRLEGLVVCRDHVRQVVEGDPPFIMEELAADQAAFLGQRCAMCEVEPAPGRLCENEDCRRPLHPQWPAVYCCNNCALEDV